MRGRPFGRGAHQCRICQHEERPALVAAADPVLVPAPVPAPIPATVQAPVPVPVPAPIPTVPVLNQEEIQVPYIGNLFLPSCFM